MKRQPFDVAFSRTRAIEPMKKRTAAETVRNRKAGAAAAHERARELRAGGVKGNATTLADLGEDRLIALLTRGIVSRASGSDLVVVGPGDDCAVLALPGCTGRRVLLKTDCVVEGIHYAPDTPPSLAGRKALARALSDIAAMAGRPLAALVTLIAPPERPARHVAALYRGLRALAEREKVAIVGGETSSGAPGSAVVVSVSVLGDVESGREILRSGARAGDRIFVTGRLGGAWKGRHHLTFNPRLREACWLARNFRPNAMMDLSDGLARDLPRLAAASGVGFRVSTGDLPRRRGAGPRAAATDGEDYELLFTISERAVAKLAVAWARRFPATPLTPIGQVVERGESTGLPDHAGWDHFRRDS